MVGVDEVECAFTKVVLGCLPRVMTDVSIVTGAFHQVHVDRSPISPAGPDPLFDQLVEKGVVVDVPGELLSHAQLPIHAVKVDDGDVLGCQRQVAIRALDEDEPRARAAGFGLGETDEELGLRVDPAGQFEGLSVPVAVQIDAHRDACRPHDTSTEKVYSRRSFTRRADAVREPAPARQAT